MITEDYVSYEVAKLLKEKGFDEACRAYYDKDGEFNWVWNCGCSRNDEFSEVSSCPTHQMAMKWLREKGVDISITPEFSTEAEPCVDLFCGYSASVFKTQNGEYIDECIIKKEEEWGSVPFVCYEDAVEAALKYCLLI